MSNLIVSETQSLRSGASAKPRLMVAGEFSSGKSTLINGLVGKEVLSTNVTATAAPPVWVVSEDVKPHCFDRQGIAHPLPADVNDTRFHLLSAQSEITKYMDVIDTPGTSDPNMGPELMEAMLQYADAIVWCTNATQAWRQSEQAVWDEIPERLRRRSTLLITHYDRITSVEERRRVVRRVLRETKDQFGDVQAASLTNPSEINRLSATFLSKHKHLTTLSGKAHAGVDAILGRDSLGELAEEPAQVFMSRRS